MPFIIAGYIGDREQKTDTTHAFFRFKKTIFNDEMWQMQKHLKGYEKNIVAHEIQGMEVS